jgi:hypothetical protein
MHEDYQIPLHETLRYWVFDYRLLVIALLHSYYWSTVQM